MHVATVSREEHGRPVVNVGEGDAELPRDPAGVPDVVARHHGGQVGRAEEGQEIVALWAKDRNEMKIATLSFYDITSTFHHPLVAKIRNGPDRIQPI